MGFNWYIHSIIIVYENEHVEVHCTRSCAKNSLIIKEVVWTGVYKWLLWFIEESDLTWPWLNWYVGMRLVRGDGGVLACLGGV